MPGCVQPVKLGGVSCQHAPSDGPVALTLLLQAGSLQCATGAQLLRLASFILEHHMIIIARLLNRHVLHCDGHNACRLCDCACTRVAVTTTALADAAWCPSVISISSQ